MKERKKKDIILIHVLVKLPKNTDKEKILWGARKKDTSCIEEKRKTDFPSENNAIKEAVQQHLNNTERKQLST